MTGGNEVVNLVLPPGDALATTYAAHLAVSHVTRATGRKPSSHAAKKAARAAESASSATANLVPFTICLTADGFVEFVPKIDGMKTTEAFLTTNTKRVDVNDIDFV